MNIGDFGRNNDENLLRLLQELDMEQEIPRIRLSSIEPDLLTDEIIDLVASSERFMPHFHIPLQSGSDTILRKMKRKYDTSLYRSRIRAINSKLPTACIAADVITGFPGETDMNFEETVSFLEDLNISYMHVFPYSPRENTLAFHMQEPVQDKIKKERSEILHRISERKKRNFYGSNMGKMADVLFESGNFNGFMHGFTQNYIKVKTLFNPGYVNHIVRLKLENTDADGMFLYRSIQ